MSPRRLRAHRRRHRARTCRPRADGRGGLDGIYLDLHGAAVAEHADDSEGELLARLRAIVGPELPIVASLDLHANVTHRMLREADALVAYRTYPHVDMADTGELAASCWSAGCAPASASRSTRGACRT
jgi:microcystin degradation protein MlrC